MDKNNLETRFLADLGVEKSFVSVQSRFPPRGVSASLGGRGARRPPRMGQLGFEPSGAGQGVDKGGREGGEKGSSKDQSKGKIKSKVGRWL